MQSDNASALQETAPVVHLSRGLERLADIVAQLPLEIECDHFYFLRHGQTECNARRIFQSEHEPLNANGIAQAEQAAEILSKEPIATIVCSNMQRAHHTARTVAARHAIEPIPHIGLRERNFGNLIGSSSAEINWDCAPASGETLDQFAHRVHAGMHEALKQPGPVLLVAHGGILYVIASALNVAVTPELLGNAHPLRFEREGDLWRATPLAQAEQASVNLA